jgi:hypothetical protein
MSANSDFGYPQFNVCNSIKVQQSVNNPNYRRQKEKVTMYCTLQLLVTILKYY